MNTLSKMDGGQNFYVQACYQNLFTLCLWGAKTYCSILAVFYKQAFGDTGSLEHYLTCSHAIYVASF